VRTRPLLRRLRELERTQWLPRAELEALQLGKLRRLLEHCRDNVPYYRELFARTGFEPGDVRGAADLARLPALDRSTLVERFDDLAARGPREKPVVRSTGGSTGRPLRFLADREDMTSRSALTYRNLGWFGWRLGDRTAYVWGSDIDSKEHAGWAGRLRDAVAGVLWLDAFRLESGALDLCLKRLREFGPRVLIGYPSSLHVLAERALESSPGLSIPGVQTSAEMLTPRARADIRKAFGATVLDRYGCREAGLVAHECPRGAMHVNAESVIMQVDGERRGEVLLTTLDNYAMPLVRYRNEDLAEMSTDACPCGRGLPVVRGIQGRVSDVIRSPAGRLIHGEFFTHLFYGIEGVRRFQVRQTQLDTLVISVVSDESFTPSDRDRLEGQIHGHGDPGFRIEWREVDQIASGPGGKFRFTISDLPQT